MFETTLDDGSWVYVDDKLVVDNGGKHAPRYQSGTIDLAAGRHGIGVRYFQDSDSKSMVLFWQPSGGEKQPIPWESLYPAAQWSRN